MSLLTPRSVGEGQAWVLAQRMCGERYTPWRLQSFSGDTVGDEHFAIRHVEPEQWGDVEVCPKSRSCLVEQYTGGPTHLDQRLHDILPKLHPHLSDYGTRYVVLNHR